MSDEQNELKMEIIRTARELGVIKAALLYGKHRNTISGWLKSYDRNGQAALTDGRSFFNLSSRMPLQVENEVLRLKNQNPDFSAAQIKSALRLDYSISAINKKLRQALTLQKSRAVTAYQPEYAFRLYTRKINIDDRSNARYAVILELEWPTLCFMMLSIEKSQFESAAFCNYLFTALKAQPHNRGAKISLLTEKRLPDSAQKALVKVYQQHQVKLIPDAAPREDFFSREIIKTLRELPGEDDYCNRLQSALILHNFMQLDQDAGRVVSSNFLLENQLLCRDRVLTKVSGSFNDGHLRVVDSLRILKSYARQAAVGADDQKAERIHKLIFELLEVYPDHQLQTELWQQVGTLLQRQGDFTKAADCFKTAIAIAQKTHNLAGVLRSRSYLGSLLVRTGKTRQAEKFYSQQISLAQKVKIPDEERQAYLSLGVIQQKQGNYNSAVRHYNAVLTIIETNGLLMHKAVALGNMADLYRRKNNFIKAREYIEEAIFLAERENNQKQLVSFYNNSGNIYESLGQSEKSLEQHQKVLATSQKINNQSFIAVALANIGQINLLLGNYAAAMTNFKKQQIILQKTGEKEHQAILFGNLGCVYMATKSYTRGENCFKKAIELGETLQCNYYLCSFYFYLADQYYLQKKFVKAQKLAAKAAKLAVEVERRGIVFLAQLLLTKTAYRLSYDKPAACRLLSAELLAKSKSERKSEYKADIYHALYLILAEQSDLGTKEKELAAECRSEAIRRYRKLYKKSCAIDYLNKINELMGTV